MLPAPVEEAILSIAEDRTSGASKLARLAVDVMGFAVIDAKGHPDPKDLNEVARRLSDAQPAMAIVHNVAHLVARLISEGLDPRSGLVEVRTELDRARDLPARTFLTVVPPHATVAADRKKPFYVACETLKFDARYDAATWPGLRIPSMNSTFEVTPSELITTTVTERGTYAPEIIRTMLSPGRDARRPGGAES